MLERLHALQKEMHEEYLKEEALKAEDQQRHFSMFGSPNKSPAGSSFSSPKGRNSKVSPTKGDKLKSPDKATTRKGYSDSENLEEDKNERRGSFNKKIKEETGQDRTTNGSLKDGNRASTGEDCRSSETGAEKSDSQIPCSSKDIEPLPGEATGNGPFHNQETGEKVVSQNGANGEKGSVDSDNIARNETYKNGTVKGSDSEDEVRQEDITVEERRARLKRTLSPSYYSEDVFRLKKQRVKDDSFMRK